MAENEQVNFWRGQFGDTYVDRNTADPTMLENRIAMWQRILKPIPEHPASFLEIGANIGLNLRALKHVTSADLFAVEPNDKARSILLSEDVLPEKNLFNATAEHIPIENGQVDCSFTSGVLIHVAPENLLASCKEIHRVSRQYVVCVEYFNPTPVEIDYRGATGFLFKRDFGSFWLDNFQDLELVDYGFFWKRATGLDDLTWWVFRKS